MGREGTGDITEFVEFFPNMHTALGSISSTENPEHDGAYLKTSTGDVEARRSEVQGHLLLHRVQSQPGTHEKLLFCF